MAAIAFATGNCFATSIFWVSYNLLAVHEAEDIMPAVYIKDKILKFPAIFEA